MQSSHHIWCHGHCCHATRNVVAAVIAPHFLLWPLSLRGCGGCCVAVMFVSWLQWVLSCCVVSQLGLLCGRVLCCGCICCVAVVGVIALCCVVVRVVAWLHFVSRLHLLYGHGGCRHTVLCCGQGCCVAVVGVVMPRRTAVIGPQKRKLAEKREKKKRKTH